MRHMLAVGAEGKSGDYGDDDEVEGTRSHAEFVSEGETEEVEFNLYNATGEGGNGCNEDSDKSNNRRSLDADRNFKTASTNKTIFLNPIHAVFAVFRLCATNFFPRLDQ